MLSKKVEYGLIALLHLDGCDAASDVTSSKEIAEHHGLSNDLMGKVMQAMARAGILDAEHGARGGYRLEGDLGGISLGQVIQAIEGRPKLVQCRHHAGDYAQSPGCIIRDPLLKVHEKLNGFIDDITLDQLRENRTANV